MPIGFVCQLHYYGGGSLLCQTSSGDSWHLPFAHAPPHVQIGHTVSFSLAAHRADLALDLKVTEKAAMSSPTEVKLQNIQEEAAKPSKPSKLSSFPKEPTRKLQRSITRFQNACLEERLEMIEAAEGLLGDLLKKAELDGDAICRLLCRCAGWLHAPGSLEAKHVAATEVASQAATVSPPRDLQHRVRRLLISALRSLDLSDGITYQAVETAVLYILQLMQGKETLFSGDSESLAMRQWWQLRELLVADHVHHGPTKRKTSGDAQDEAARRVSKDRSRALDRVYRPNERVRSLPTVYEAPDRVVQLKCSRCTERSSTSWFLKQPRTGRIYALVPLNGHQTCRKMMGKKCPWISLDGSDTRSDDFEHLDFCHHKCRRSMCKECGGRDLCPHKRRKSRCSVCKIHAPKKDGKTE